MHACRFPAFSGRLSSDVLLLGVALFARRSPMLSGRLYSVACITSQTVHACRFPVFSGRLSRDVLLPVVALLARRSPMLANYLKGLTPKLANYLQDLSMVCWWVDVGCFNVFGTFGPLAPAPGTNR